MRVDVPVRIGLLALLSTAGCRQLLGLEPPHRAADAAPDVEMATHGYQKPITIDHTKVTTALVDFPVWIDITDAELAAGALADGSDLVFTDGAGTPLRYELTGWDPSAGHLSAWIKLALAPDVDQTLFLRYGDPGSISTSDSASVFSSSFVAVWHLDDTLASPTVADATKMTPGTATGGLDATHSTAAQLGRGIAFDGAMNEISFTNPLTGTMSHTISAWVDEKTATGYDAVLALGTASTNESRFLHAVFTNNTVSVGFFSNDWTPSGINLQNAGPTLLHWVFDGAAGTSSLYRNGQLVAGSPYTHASGINTQGTAGTIGNAPAPQYGTSNGLNGILDEIRIATVTRSAGWIATEYANQSSPSTFYRVGSAEPVP